MKWNRREVLAGLLSLPAAAGTIGAFANNRGSAFAHGVASGDPDESSVVLWTRITSRETEPEVSWQIARDRQFKRIVNSGTRRTNATRDFTLKVLVDSLDPGTTYYYRFRIGEETSITGRTRTLPVGSIDSLNLALASCSNFAFGFFNAYEAIAKDKDVDFVLHTGDYIYEYGADGWGGDVARRLNRLHEPAHEIVSLLDYRTRHAQYKADMQSIAMHAAHPLLCLWDDHESTNNPWHGGAQNHQPDEGTWADRREASLTAYYEWMPIREPGTGRSRAEFWRRYRFGDLATLVTIESRHTARAEQVDYAAHMNRINSPEDARRFERDVLGQPGRRMLSADMTDFLMESLAVSVEQGQPWRILGNAIPMAKTPVPDVSAEGIAMPGGTVPGVSADLVWKGRYNLPFYLDTWDGYPWAREMLYQQCREIGVSDLLVLTGDSHSFWANTLHTADGHPMGVEVGTAGISSPGDFVETGFDPDTARRLDALFAERIPEVRWTDNMHQGYVRLNLSREAARVTYIGVDTVYQPKYKTKVLREEIIQHQGESLAYV